MEPAVLALAFGHDFPLPHQQFVFEEYKRAIHELEERCKRLEQVLVEAINAWPLAPIVMALQALRGIKLIAAATLVAEIGDLHRFDSPKQLMAWIGLVPAEHSSGKWIKRGEITRAADAAARSMLIESAWHYRFPAWESRALRERGFNIPDHIRAIGWKAQVRLCSKYRRLAKAGKNTVKVVTAVARELAGCEIAQNSNPAQVRLNLLISLRNDRELKGPGRHPTATLDYIEKSN